MGWLNLDPRPDIFPSAFAEVSFCVTIYFTQLFTQASLGNVLIVIQIIATNIGVSNAAALPWFIAAYSLTVGVFILITGRLGEIYGHKRLLVCGFAWYALHSLLLGFATYIPSDIYFDVIRACQGLGPAILLPNGVALLAHAYPNGHRKTMVFAFFGACAPSGFVLGAVFASIFAQLVLWSWAQWVLAIICALIALAAQFLVIPKEISAPINPKAKLDWLGTLTGVCGLVLIIYAWNEAPVVGWDKVYVFIFIPIGMLLVFAFIAIEAYVEQPIMPLDIWTHAGFPVVILTIVCGWGSFGIFIYYTVTLLQVYRGNTPLLTTAELVPIVFAGLAATMLMARLDRFLAKHYILTIALCAFCLANILIALAPVDATYWSYIFVALCIAPFGMDISYPCASLIVSNSLPIERQGVGASMINTAVNLSISLGLGIAGTVQAENVKHGVSAIDAQRSALYVGVGLSGLGIIVAFFFCRVPDHSHDKSTTAVSSTPNQCSIHNAETNHTKAIDTDIEMTQLETPASYEESVQDAKITKQDITQEEQHDESNGIQLPHPDTHINLFPG